MVLGFGMWVWVLGLGFRVEDFRIEGLGFSVKVQGLGFKI